MSTSSRTSLVEAWRRLDARVRDALVVLGTAALVALLLLNGACSSTPMERHCWQPGRCRVIDGYDEGCSAGESMDTGPCPTAWRVGSCVAPDGDRIYLYAPLHGLLPPNCERVDGSGSVFVPE